MAILSCHVSIKLPPKISDGQGNSWVRMKASRKYHANPLAQNSCRTVLVPRWSGFTRPPVDVLGLQFRENRVYPRSSSQ